MFALLCLYVIYRAGGIIFSCYLLHLEVMVSPVTVIMIRWRSVDTISSSYYRNLDNVLTIECTLGEQLFEISKCNQ